MKYHHGLLQGCISNQLNVVVKRVALSVTLIR